MTEAATQPKSVNTTACQNVHPEDLRVGEFVVVLQQSYQLGTYNWCGLDAHQFPPDRPIELTLRGVFDGLLEVQEVCFPFVLCRDYHGNAVVLDARSTELGRLSESFADGYKTLMKSKSNGAEETKSKRKKKRESKKRKR